MTLLSHTIWLHVKILRGKMMKLKGMIVASQWSRQSYTVFLFCCFKALFKWLKTPAIASHDCTMIAVSLKVVAMLALNEELSWQMIYSNSLIACLEDGGKLHWMYVTYTE